MVMGNRTTQSADLKHNGGAAVSRSDPAQLY
jgi:hypothetical protein